MKFRTLAERAVTVRQQYTELEYKRHGRSWTNEEIALGFVGDVGDLAKLVIACEKRSYVKEKVNYTIKPDEKFGFLELIDVPNSAGRGQRAVP